MRAIGAPDLLSAATVPPEIPCAKPGAPTAIDHNSVSNDASKRGFMGTHETSLARIIADAVVVDGGRCARFRAGNLGRHGCRGQQVGRADGPHAGALQRQSAAMRRDESQDAAAPRAVQSGSREMPRRDAGKARRAVQCESTALRGNESKAQRTSGEMQGRSAKMPRRSEGALRA